MSRVRPILLVSIFQPSSTNDQFLAGFCDTNRVLGPDNDFGYVEQTTADDYRVQVYVAWADDQSGCGDKKDFETSSSNRDSKGYNACRNLFLGPFQCHRDEDDSDGKDTSYGGQYVYNSGEGCVLLQLYGLALQEQNNVKRLLPEGTYLLPNASADDRLPEAPQNGFYNKTTLEWTSSGEVTTLDPKMLLGFNTTRGNATESGEA